MSKDNTFLFSAFLVIKNEGKWKKGIYFAYITILIYKLETAIVPTKIINIKVLPVSYIDFLQNWKRKYFTVVFGHSSSFTT